jgi:hypothetical protein
LAQSKIMRKHITLLCLFGLLTANCLASEQQFLLECERRYGVPLNLLSGVYFVESSEGKILGDTKAVDVLSPKQIKYLRKIAQHTGRSIKEFRGSTAGAIGPFQFMPGTWWQYKQDGNGDNVRDPLNFYDAGATAAFYLAHLIELKGLDTALLKYAGALTQGRTYPDRVLSYRSLDPQPSRHDRR